MNFEHCFLVYKINSDYTTYLYPRILSEDETFSFNKIVEAEKSGWTINPEEDG